METETIMRVKNYAKEVNTEMAEKVMSSRI